MPSPALQRCSSGQRSRRRARMCCCRRGEPDGGGERRREGSEVEEASEGPALSLSYHDRIPSLTEPSPMVRHGGTRALRGSAVPLAR
eukprot:2459941-Prymnesium_polylepis.1